MVIVLAIALGFVAGVLAGLFGVGGGILFVPTLALGLGLTQLHAEATSLLAIIPTVIAGTWRQRHYGNVRWRPAVVIGVAAIGGVEGGVAPAESPPQHPIPRTAPAYTRRCTRSPRRLPPTRATPARSSSGRTTTPASAFASSPSGSSAPSRRAAARPPGSRPRRPTRRRGRSSRREQGRRN